MEGRPSTGSRMLWRFTVSHENFCDVHLVFSHNLNVAISLCVFYTSIFPGFVGLHWKKEWSDTGMLHFMQKHAECALYPVSFYSRCASPC